MNIITKQLKHCCLVLATGGLLLISSCKNPPAIPFADQIKKVWTAQIVRENNVLVYTRNAAGNIRNYTKFRLDLSNPPTVSLTEFDGNSFVGKYELQGTTKLILKELSPAPSGTGGIIEYNISSGSSTNLNLSRTAASPKTGGTLNQYELTNP
jgi:hypothetical protein